MKLKADKNGNTRYFLAKLGWREHFDSREIEMLYSHAVPALIPPSSVQGRRNNIMRFDISSYTTLEYYLSFALTCEQFSELLLACISTFQKMQQLYMNCKNLVLDLDKIYIQLSDRSVRFIYLPLADSKREASFPAFFRHIFSHVSRSTYELSQFLDECTAWLDRPAAFTLDEFAALIHRHMYHSAPVPAGSPIACPPQFEKDPYYHPPLDGSTPAVLSSFEAPRSPGGAGGTVLLQATEAPSAPHPQAYLIRLKTSERIPLTFFPFLVGSESGVVTYCVSDNPAISRRHAQFTLENGQIYLTDLGSTNKTYVNDCALVPSVPQCLDSEAKIRFANEPYTFLLEAK